MNKVLAAALLIALAGNGYLAWYLNSHIEPTTSQLDNDIAALRGEREAIAGRKLEGSQAQVLDTILAQTQAMLEQKRATDLRFIDVQYRVDGRSPEKVSATELAQIKADLAEQEAALTTAKDQLDRYAGRLIRVVISMRVEVRQLSVALLKQKELLQAYGMTLPSLRTTAPPLPEDMAGLEEEIRRKASEINKIEVEARRYSGGLIQVTLLMRAETEKMTLSMLDQRYLALKYQIGLPIMDPAVAEKSKQTQAPGKVVSDKEALQ